MYLQLKNVTKKFGKEVALDNIDFSLNKGELVCLLGPSGCGKTTILNIIGGFIEDYEGDVRLEENSLKNILPEERPVATVFQSYGLFPHKNVFDNVAYGLKFHKINKSKRVSLVEEMLEKVGLTGYGKKNISELSGGEAQRVALARSLILKPRVLLLDEPFSNLDANLRVTMRKEVRNLQKKFDVTMIVVTHDREDAFEIADKIILMNKGKIEQIATPSELYNKPKNNFVANFIGDVNLINEKIVRPENIKLTLSRGENSCKAKVVSKKFKGALLEYTIIYEENELRVLTLNDGHRFEVGEEVFFTIN